MRRERKLGAAPRARRRAAAHESRALRHHDRRDVSKGQQGLGLQHAAEHCC